MARSAIPDFGIEYPAWTDTPWPRHVGFDAEGEVLTAKDQAEFDSLKEIAVLPKVMGRDKHGKDVIAHIPRDLEWKKALVATPPEDPAVVKKREEDAAAAEAAIRRKAQAYDDLMAANALGTQTTAGPAVNAATGLKKAKAA